VESFSYGFSKSLITRVDVTRSDSIGHKRPRCTFSELSSSFENFIILGGSGDLATTKIIPGLFHLCKQYSALNGESNVPTISNQEISKLQPRIPYPRRHFKYHDFTVKLAARSDWSNDFLRKKLEIILLNENKDRSVEGEDFHTKLVDEFLRKCFYTRVDSYDVDEMSQLMSVVTEDDANNNKENAVEITNNNNNNNDNYNTDNSSNNDESDSVHNIVYFALPPKQYLPALQSIRSIQTFSENIPNNLKNPTSSSESKTIKIKNSKNADTGTDSDLLRIIHRFKNTVDIVLEKPIGYDSKTALEITELALSAVNNSSENLWCVDHYLAKDLASLIIPLKTSQNPLISRLFNDYLNSRLISRLDVIFSDTSILDGRSGYFDDCGIVRDILQNHLIQLLALVCCDTELDPRIYSEYFDDSNSDDSDNTKMSNVNNQNDNNASNNNINNNHWNLLSSENKSKIISKKRSEILSRIRDLRPSELEVGQYDSYKTEKGVKIGSTTSTFASSKMQVILFLIYCIIFSRSILYLISLPNPTLLIFFFSLQSNALPRSKLFLIFQFFSWNLTDPRSVVICGKALPSISQQVKALMKKNLL
jgi:glucose-6-phosphate 1-dehydrogenase